MSRNFGVQQVGVGHPGPPVDVLLPATQDQLALGGVALSTVFGVILLIREVRLLVSACKK